MTSSRKGGTPEGRAAPCDSEAPQGEAKLLAEGWQRCFVADEPRLSEAVEAYREIGYEVTLLPFAPDDSLCSECIASEPGRCFVIYVRGPDRS